jgi:hypothetical protein
LVISVCAILACERGTDAVVDLFDLIERVLSDEPTQQSRQLMDQNQRLCLLPTNACSRKASWGCRTRRPQCADWMTPSPTKKHKLDAVRLKRHFCGYGTDQ